MRENNSLITKNMTSKDQTQEMDDMTASNDTQETASPENMDSKNPQNRDEKENDGEEAVEQNGTPDALAELQENYDALNDKFLRLYSEFENYRRRTAKEKLDALRNGGSDIAKDLLPVLDDFDRAVASNDNIDDTETLKEGFILIHSKLKRILESKGLKEMDSMEKPFDTEFHDAITNIPAPTEELKGKVVDVAEKGYFFNDMILRHAKVIVGK